MCVCVAIVKCVYVQQTMREMEKRLNIRLASTQGCGYLTREPVEHSSVSSFLVAIMSSRPELEVDGESPARARKRNSRICVACEIKWSFGIEIYHHLLAKSKCELHFPISSAGLHLRLCSIAVLSDTGWV